MVESLNLAKVEGFRSLVWDFYDANRRSFDWREDPHPYRVFVSEIMLQQTQTSRVAVKFPAFIRAFPDFDALGRAPFETVLREWQGMGYTRRAKWMREAALIIARDYSGNLPLDLAALHDLPGIGKATAASMYCFAFNLPSVFLETNIRTVLIHHFFPEEERISDSQLLPLADAVLDRERPRDWYYALMDYGVHLKKTVGNLSRRSTLHRPQSKYIGSKRQVRAAIIRILVENPSGPTDRVAIAAGIRSAGGNPDFLEDALVELVAEGFIVAESSGYRVKETSGDN